MAFSQFNRANKDKHLLSNKKTAPYQLHALYWTHQSWKKKKKTYLSLLKNYNIKAEAQLIYKKQMQK